MSNVVLFDRYWLQMLTILQVTFDLTDTYGVRFVVLLDVKLARLQHSSSSWDL